MHDIEVRVYRSAIKIPVIFFVPAAFLATIYALAYLYLNSNFFLKTLHDQLNDVFPGTIAVREVVLDSTLMSAKIFEGRLLAPEGHEVIRLKAANASLDLPSLLVQRIELYDLEVYNARVKMTMSKEPGKSFDLIEALGVGGDDDEERSDGFPRGVTLRNVACFECSYGLDVDFFKAEVPLVTIPNGRVDVGKILQISVPALQVPNVKLWFSNFLFGYPESKGPWEIDIQDVEIRRWAWSNEGFNVEHLSLEADGVMAWATGDMRFPEREDSDETQMLYKAQGQFYIPYRTGFIHYFLDNLLHIEATVTMAVEGSFDEIAGRFLLESPVLEAQGVFLTDARAEGYLLDDVFIAESLTAKLHKGEIELEKLLFSMFEGIWSIKGKFSGVDPEGLLGDLQMEYPWLAGDARGEITGIGWVPFSPEIKRPGDDPIVKRWAEARNPMAWLHLDGDMNLTRTSREILPGPRLRLPRGSSLWTTQEAVIIGDMPVVLDDVDARVQNFRFNWKTGLLEQGPLPGPARIRLNARDLPSLLKHYGVDGVGGSAELDLGIRGRMNYPELEFSGRWGNPVLVSGEEVALQDIDFRGAIRDGIANFSPIFIKSKKGDLNLSGSARVLKNPANVIDPKTGQPTGEFLFENNPGLQLDYELKEIEVAFFDKWLKLNTGVEGFLDSRGAIYGPASGPTVSADGRLVRGQVLGQQLDEVTVKGEFSQRHANIDELVVDAGAAGKLRGRGQADLRQETFEFQARGEDLEIALIRPLTERSTVSVQGFGQFELHGGGTFRRPQIGGYLLADAFRVDDRDLGDVSVVVNTLGEIIHLAGALPGLAGFSAEIPLDAESPFYARLVLDRLDLKRSIREMSETALIEDANATGSIELFVRRDMERYQLLLNLNRLELQTLGRRFYNEGPVIVGINDGSLLQIQNAKIGSEGRFVEIEGGLFLDEALLDIAMRGELDLALVNSFRVTFPEYFPDFILEASGMVELDTALRGTPEGLMADGFVKILPSEIQLRDINAPLILTSGLVRFGEGGFAIDSEQPIRGRALDGVFELFGGVRFVGSELEDLRLQLRSVNMSYRISEVANLTFGSDVEFRARDLSRPETWTATGLVDIVDGLYYQNISVFQQQFTNRLLGAFNRTSQSYEASLVERIPWLEDVSFDLQVRARDSFRIRSEIDRLGLDLELRLDVKIQETLLSPRITGGVDIIDGRVAFQNEVFDVRSGSLTFEGNPENPRVDIIADADISNRCRQPDLADSSRNSLRLTGDVGRDEQRGYRVVLNVSGTLDNLDVRFESNPYADQRDVLSLILTGCTVDQLTASSASSPTLEVALAPVLGWIEGTVQDVVAVEEFTITPSVDRLRTSIGDRLSRRLSWRLEVDTGLTQSTGGQRYELNYKISDSWSAELSESTRSESDSFVVDFKLKYRLLLD